MATPGVVGAVAVGTERAPELGHGEQRDVVLHADLVHCVRECIEVAADDVQQRSLRRQFVVVGVETAHLHEEDLSRIQCGVGLDGERHLVQLLTQVPVVGDGREGGAQGACGGEGVVDDGHLVGRADQQVGEFCGHQVGIGARQRDQCLRSLLARAVAVVRVFGNLEGWRPAGAHGVGLGDVAFLPVVAAVQGQVDRELGREALLHQHVGHAAGPAGARGLVGQAGHPFGGLVEMREQLPRQRD